MGSSCPQVDASVKGRSWDPVPLPIVFSVTNVFFFGLLLIHSDLIKDTEIKLDYEFLSYIYFHHKKNVTTKNIFTRVGLY